MELSVATCRSAYCTTDVSSVGVVLFLTQQDRIKTSEQNTLILQLPTELRDVILNLHLTKHFASET